VLDEPFEKVKDLARRVVLGFDHDPPLVPDLGTIIYEKRSGRDLDLVVYPWNEAGESALRALNATRLEIGPLSLEDVFTSFVGESANKQEGPDHV
jgi:hypothetical protein